MYQAFHVCSNACESGELHPYNIEISCNPSIHALQPKAWEMIAHTLPKTEESSSTHFHAHAVSKAQTYTRGLSASRRRATVAGASIPLWAVAAWPTC
jgi:hypothetical protein